MASVCSLVLLSLSLLAVRAAAAARPCETLLVSYSIASRDPTFDLSGVATSSVGETSRYSAVYRVISSRRYYYFSNLSDSSSVDLSRRTSMGRPNVHHVLHDRERDVLAVVVVLLLGLNFCLLGLAMMHLAWYLITTRLEIYDEDDDGDEKQVAEAESPRKFWYVEVADGPNHAPAKSGYDGK